MCPMMVSGLLSLAGSNDLIFYAFRNLPMPIIVVMANCPEKAHKKNAGWVLFGCRIMG